MRKIFSTLLALTLVAVLAVAVSAAMFTDVDSYAKFEMTGEPVYAMDEDYAEYWTGNWDSMGENGDEVIVEVLEGVGYNGTKGISVSSGGTSNVGLYLYATADNGIAKDYTGAAYLRVWMDLTNVAFRKANFGVMDSTYCLFTTDEVDGAWECPFYYSADGANWTEMFHGGDGCLGDAQDSDVFGLKGWFAFPVKDFTIRSNANWEAYDELTPANVADVAAVYLFWDYSDNYFDQQGNAFVLDNIEFVADYKAFDYEVVASAAAPGAVDFTTEYDGVAVFAATIPTIDGEIDAAWDIAETFESSYPGDLNGEGISGYSKVMWDENNLYLLAFVNDDTISPTTDAATCQDSVDLWVSETNSEDLEGFPEPGDYVFTVTPYGPRGELAGADGVTWATKLTDTGYIVEAQIAWRTEGFKGATGKIMAYNISFNNDLDGDNVRDSWTSWQEWSSRPYWSNTISMNVIEMKGSVVAQNAAGAAAAPAAEAAPAAIEHCYYNYVCPQSVNEVTPDGVYNEAEWAEAEALVINNDTLQDYGRWQSTGDPLPANEFAATYKFKWDENYFYVLEVRTDAHYVSDFDGWDYYALNPWYMDGTAIFFCDNAIADQSMRCDIKYYSYVDDIGAPSVYIGNPDGNGFSDESGSEGCVYGGSINGDTIVFELKMPWAVMDDLGYLDSEIKEGTVFRFTPIIMNRDTIDDYNVWDGSSYRQMNFHDCVNIPAEGVTGAEDPNYWAALTLSAPAVTFGVQEATGSFDGEVADNLFDGDETTKWCFDSTAFTEPYVIWNVENPINVTGYEIVTANDNADYTGRNPGAWTLSGSADGQSWTVIADVADDKVLQDVNFTPFTFAADAAGEYSWFKYEIKNVVGGGVCQISGLNLLTGDVTPSAAPAEEVVEEEVVEEPAVEEPEVVEEAPAEEETVEEAPAEEAVQTFDAAIIAAVAAIVSAAGYAISKKH